MYLESEIGMNILESLKKGKTIPTISSNALNNMEVLCPPIEIQNNIANNYYEKVKMINELQKKLYDKENELKMYSQDIFQELCENNIKNLNLKNKNWIININKVLNFIYNDEYYYVDSLDIDVLLNNNNFVIVNKPKTKLR